jgi:hypothetical protein
VVHAGKRADVNMYLPDGSTADVTMDPRDKPEDDKGKWLPLCTTTSLTVTLSLAVTTGLDPVVHAGRRADVNMDLPDGSTAAVTMDPRNKSEDGQEGWLLLCGNHVLAALVQAFTP